MRRPTSSFRGRRRGITSVMVLICLVLVTLMSGVLFKIGVAHRAQVRDQERQIQAEWLAQAGLERALHRRAADPVYAGETWKIAARDLGAGSGARSDALILIQVEPVKTGAETIRIKVQADYPPDPPQRVRHSIQVQVQPGSLKRGATP